MADPLLDSADAQVTLGVYLQPGIAAAYPEARAGLLDLYRDKVSKWPWIPFGWWDAVAALAAKWPDAVVLLQPAYAGNGKPVAGVPAWIAADTARRESWQQVVVMSKGAYDKFRAGREEEARADLDAANARADFWNVGAGAAIITAAEAIRDAPGNAVAAVGQGAVDVLTSFVKRAWWVLLLVAIGAFVWFNRSAIAGKANRAAAKAVGL